MISMSKDCFGPHAGHSQLFVTAFLAMTLICATVSFATTPLPQRMSNVTSITLTYDLDKSSLHVEAVHPSNNWEIDYVRMMTVSLNSQVVSTLNYYHQTSAAGFSEDVAVNAQVGDVITVQLFCTGGSSMSKDLTVTKPGE